MGQQASRHSSGYAVRWRKTVRPGSRAGPGRTRGVYAGDHRQRGEVARPPSMEDTTTIAFDHRTGRATPVAGQYDYVIVGAGSAGCVVARRLLDGTNATVLLLEAGGSEEGVQSISNPPRWVENIGSPYDWAYRYEPSPHVAHRAIPLSLGRVLGGSGRINGMVW